jgi:hypothetical protein
VSGNARNVDAGAGERKSPVDVEAAAIVLRSVENDPLCPAISGKCATSIVAVRSDEPSCAGHQVRAVAVPANQPMKTNIVSLLAPVMVRTQLNIGRI